MKRLTYPQSILVGMSVRAVALATVSVVLGLALSGCALGRNGAAGSKFVPKKPGVLTVATSFLPAPGFWFGPGAKRGFESGLALALAHKLGLEEVRLVQVPFAQVTRGDLDGADLGLSQVTPTAEREKTASFSTPYLTGPPGVLARRGVDAVDLKGLRELRWVVGRVSTLTPIVTDVVRPSRAPIVVEDRTSEIEVLSSGRADAMMLDLPVALGLARANALRFHVLGQLSGGESLAAVLPKGSPNLEIVDSSIRALTANGTIAQLSSKWLGSQSDIPLIRSEP
jgi:polar amino acid transport system substrate-binding protein